MTTTQVNKVLIFIAMLLGMVSCESLSSDGKHSLQIDEHFETEDSFSFTKNFALMHFVYFDSTAHKYMDGIIGEEIRDTSNLRIYISSNCKIYKNSGSLKYGELPAGRCTISADTLKFSLQDLDQDYVDNLSIYIHPDSSSFAFTHYSINPADTPSYIPLQCKVSYNKKHLLEKHRLLGHLEASFLEKNESGSDTVDVRGYFSIPQKD